MVRVTGTDIGEGPGKERDTERVASRDRQRERTVHRETDVQRMLIREGARTRTHAHTQKWKI